MSNKGEVTLDIRRVRKTGELKVRFGTRFHYLFNPKRSTVRYHEDKAYYTDDPEDAVSTLKDMAIRARRQGFTVKVRGVEPTRSLIKRYSKSKELGSLGNTTLFTISDTSSSFPLGMISIEEAKRVGGRH